MERAASGQAASTSGRRLKWECTGCQRECFVIRAESRCICGHRYKDHSQAQGWGCQSNKCPCRRFFYIFAEGSFILRCRCKHKHTEHDPNTRACARADCVCTRFDSPWVCNCDHAWGAHRQVEADAVQDGFMHSVAEINRWDLLRRGDDGDGGGGS